MELTTTTMIMIMISKAADETLAAIMMIFFELLITGLVSGPGTIELNFTAVVALINELTLAILVAGLLVGVYNKTMKRISS